jgi:hypothetical protein
MFFHVHHIFRIFCWKKNANKNWLIYKSLSLIDYFLIFFIFNLKSLIIVQVEATWLLEFKFQQLLFEYWTNLKEKDEWI